MIFVLEANIDGPAFSFTSPPWVQCSGLCVLVTQTFVTPGFVVAIAIKHLSCVEKTVDVFLFFFCGLRGQGKKGTFHS